MSDPDSVGHGGSTPSTTSFLRVRPEDDLAVAVLIPSPYQSAAPGGPWVGELTDVLREALLRG